MIKDLTFKELREPNVGRCEEVYHGMCDWTPSDIGNDLAGEVGELCNFIKKMRRLYFIKDMTEQEKAVQFKKYLAEVKKELADVILYADLLAAKLGIRLDEAVIAKFNETSVKIKSTYFLSNNHR